MRQRGIFIAIGLLILVNVVVLVGVSYNRSSESEAELVLTERELPLTYAYRRQENSGVALRINSYHAYYYPGRFSSDDFLFTWLDKQKLEALGFVFNEPINEQDKYNYFSRQLPRRTYAVLEYSGNVWEQWKVRREQEVTEIEREILERKKTDKDLAAARKSYERELLSGSRLFIVDAGNDAAALRKQYADRARFLIIPAKVHISYYASFPAPNSKEPRIRGHVELLITEVNVPRRLHAIFDEKTGTGALISNAPYLNEHAPRYQVVLCSGKRFEPWIRDIQPIKARQSFGTEQETNADSVILTEPKR